MTGISITSTASSFFNKLRGKSNPYEKSYRTQSYVAPTSHTNLSPPSAHPDTDLLAEARQAAGRDAVTGRRQVEATNQTFVQKQPPLQSSGQTASEQKAAYLAWAAQRPQERGKPYGSYEEFVQEMIEKRDGRREAGDGSSSYYAPERRVEEYYSERVRY
ncbi:hypothetical protein yc1106_03227 [Curvularia clavata]|uniref:Uncharacterized protein n=1 Tax=Curvularia clavata TaxID=95742 RepID=A0A9Q9DQ62_CURCL|nr:hypothetical protein yc1106_03227 [Curvularia clavata]